ncbi:MAG: nucleoside-diphosphate sugar epimerase/dehydratase [Syntrophales bacterium]|nr:nucleoside-diphosphate sugar epimerase/dehydratase [Syntrophales bacterium]
MKNLLHPTAWKKFIFFFMSDIILFYLSLLLALLFHFDLNLNIRYNPLIFPVLPFFVAVKIGSFFIFRIYKMTWRYVGLYDFLSIFIATVVATFVLMLFVILPGNCGDTILNSGEFRSCPQIFGFLLWDLPLSGFSKRVVLADGIITLFLISGLRVSKRIYSEVLRERRLKNRGGKRTLIVGAGNAGEMILRDMMKQGFDHFLPVGFLDDDPMKTGTYIHGIKVLGGTDELARVVPAYDVQGVLLAIPTLNHQKLRDLYNAAKKAGVSDIKIIPRIYNFSRPDINLRDLEEISIEDLIGRQSIAIDAAGIEGFLKGRRILVTGAGGSIGSELVMQVCTYQPAEVTLFDIDETELHNLGLKLHRRFPQLQGALHFVTGDVRDERRVDKVFQAFRPQVVFHAAAYKHVPMMEHNATEAVKVNILGTHILTGCAVAHGVEKFIMISTDKAVRPTSVMGATKRVAEYICQAVLIRDRAPINSELIGALSLIKTQFVSVRFGNVLGSRGSVLPLFLDQLKHGEALTVTHKEMKRYFMTIPEAVSLVLQAAVIGNDGEVMVLDMGEPVRLMEFAEELIRLHGLEPYKDIDVRVTGLRPGEKLFEEILTAEEGTDASRHEKIFIARNSTGYSREETENMIAEFAAAISRSSIQDEREIKDLLKKYVKYYEEGSGNLGTRS